MKARTIGVMLAAAMALSIGASQCAGSVQPFVETQDQRNARMAWWREARFGLFIHWGVYSVPAGKWNGKDVPNIGEWIMNTAKIPTADYQKLPAQFNPVKFDANLWVKLAKDAGMKYIVITSKHHDGFAMFRSKVSPFNIYDATPFKRDPLKELSKACAKQGIKLGFYYSQAQDWNHPGGAAGGGRWDKAQDGSMDDYVRDIAVPQVKEILTNYGPISIMWWDTPVDMNKERADMLLPLMKLQPGIIMNNRLGYYDGDFGTPEQQIPTAASDTDWETCMTMNDTWGYKSEDNNWKSTKTLVRNLIDIASKGGNYLLNVGPTSLGEIPPPSVQRLKEIGAWMKVNGEAIHGTTKAPFDHMIFDGRCTMKGNKLYLFVFEWPSSGIRIEGLNPVASARLLDGGEMARYSTQCVAEKGRVVTILPPSKTDPIATVIELTYEGKPEL
jgi:alpha-L-fucosidase